MKLKLYKILKTAQLRKMVGKSVSWTRQHKIVRECLCKSGPVDFAWDTDLAHFLCLIPCVL